MTQSSYKNRLAIVVATKDRPNQLRSVLTSIKGQSVQPQQIVVVDGGDDPIEAATREFPDLPISYITVCPPGLTKQKNAGVSATHPDMNLIGFIDDDMILEDGALAAMLDFWEAASQEMGGASFNLPDFENTNSWIKSMPQRLFFIDNHEFGRVHRSGFNSTIWNPATDSQVQWLGGGYTVWRKQVFEHFQFDEWFAGSGLWEDVRFSHQVGRNYQLSVVAKAKAVHVDAPITVDRQFLLGKTQIINWIYFVKNDPDLSILMCIWACLGRTGINLFKGVLRLNRNYLLRSMGNFSGLLSGLFGGASGRRKNQPDQIQTRS